MLAAALALATGASAAEFATKGGAAPANIQETSAVLRNDPYDLELVVERGPQVADEHVVARVVAKLIERQRRARPCGRI